MHTKQCKGALYSCCLSLCTSWYDEHRACCSMLVLLTLSLIILSSTCPLVQLLLQVLDINPWKAWSAVAITLSSVAASLYLIAISPWYLLPLAWAFAGTAWTGVSPPVASATLIYHTPHSQVLPYILCKVFVCCNMSTLLHLLRLCSFLLWHLLRPALCCSL